MRVFNANDKEFLCPCADCVKIPDRPGIENSVLKRLNAMQRTLAVEHYGGNAPDMTITSGRRCQKHNDSLPNSAPNSLHVRGLAVDIYTGNDAELRHAVVDSAMVQYMRCIEIDQMHVHCDMRPIVKPILILANK